MIRRPVLSVLLVAALALCASSLAACHHSSAPPSSERTYTSPQFGFSVNYDPQVLVERVDSGYSGGGALTVDFLLRGVAFATPPPRGSELLGAGEGLAVWARRHSKPQALPSPEAVRRWYVKVAPKTLTVGPASAVTIPGATGVRVPLAWRGGHGFYYDFAVGNTVYHVTLWADDAAWATYGAADTPTWAREFTTLETCSVYELFVTAPGVLIPLQP